jgi:RimJ/RimL family protein N-acetyltransferase
MFGFKKRKNVHTEAYEEYAETARQIATIECADNTNLNWAVRVDYHISKMVELDCKIRSWKMDDADDLATALNSKKTQDNLRDGIPFPYTVNDAREFISAMLYSEKNKIYAFAITVDDKVIGSIGVFRKDNIHSQTAEMGYYISELYWGQGYGTCAVKQVCELIFNTTDIIRIFAEPFAYNIASCRILEKSGFSLEGVLKKNAVKNGDVIDMKMYALVKE